MHTTNNSRNILSNWRLAAVFFWLPAIALVVAGACGLNGRSLLGGNGWNLIGLAVLIGAVAFCCLPELALERYRGRRSGP